MSDAATRSGPASAPANEIERLRDALKRIRDYFDVSGRMDMIRTIAYKALRGDDA